jgi:nitrite reductase/ring-hydroxylating ferredoxin subunit
MRPKIIHDGKEYTLLGYEEDFSPGVGRHYQIDKWDVAVFVFGDDYFTIDNECPHEGGDLSKGIQDNDVIICPMHAWAYQLKDGENLTSPGTDVATYPTIKKDGKIFACLS